MSASHLGGCASIVLNRVMLGSQIAQRNKSNCQCDNVTCKYGTRRRGRRRDRTRTRNSNCRRIAKLSIALTVLSLIGSMSAKPAISAETIQGRLDRAAYFAASKKNASFPVRGVDGRLSLVLVDFESGKSRKLGVKSSDVLSPYLSSDGSRLLFAVHPAGQPGSELVSCETQNFVCTSLFKSDGRISSPVEYANGGILFVYSPYNVGFDGKGRYNRNDVWLLDSLGKAQKLTDLGLYQISSINIADGALFFSGYGPGPNNPSIPKPDPDASEQSDIYALPLSAQPAAVPRPSKTLTPLFLKENGKARSPAVSADGTVLAYLRTPLNIGNYKYDLIVRNGHTGSEIELKSTGLGFSRPVAVERSIYANVIDAQGYSIQYFDWAEPRMRQVAALTDAEINLLDSLDLKIIQK